MRLRAEERKLIERLKAKLHLESSALIRLALIRLAEAENVLHK